MHRSRCKYNTHAVYVCTNLNIINTHTVTGEKCSIERHVFQDFHKWHAQVLWPKRSLAFPIFLVYAVVLIYQNIKIESKLHQMPGPDSSDNPLVCTGLCGQRHIGQMSVLQYYNIMKNRLYLILLDPFDKAENVSLI